MLGTGSDRTDRPVTRSSIKELGCKLLHIVFKLCRHGDGDSCHKSTCPFRHVEEQQVCDTDVTNMNNELGSELEENYNAKKNVVFITSTPENT